MKRDVLDIIHRWLIGITFVFALLFTILMIGHGFYLVYEKVVTPKKSELRWKMIDNKFKTYTTQKNDTTFYWHSHPHNGEHTHPSE